MSMETWAGRPLPNPVARLICVVGLTCWAACAPASLDADEHGNEHGAENDDEHDEDDESEEGVVHLGQRAIERSGIRVAAVSTGTGTAWITAPAKVHLNPETVAHVSSLVDGQIRAVYASIGDAVVADQPLAEVRSVAIGEARADLRQANALLDVAEAEYERQERLRTSGIAAERAYLQADGEQRTARAVRDAARARLDVFGLRGGRGPDMDLVSPIGGEVLERHATRGESISSQDTLFLVADLDRIWVIGRVYEQDMSAVSQGADATMTFLGLPGHTFEGTVDWVGSVLEEDTRTLSVRVELDNHDRLLRPGSFGSMLIAVGTPEANRVTVPDTALQVYEGRDTVFVPEAHEPGAFRAVPVVTGARAGGMVTVLEGLTVGDTVVVEGAFVLKAHLLRGELGNGHAH